MNTSDEQGWDGAMSMASSDAAGAMQFLAGQAISQLWDGGEGATMAAGGPPRPA